MPCISQVEKEREREKRKTTKQLRFFVCRCYFVIISICFCCLQYP